MPCANADLRKRNWRCVSAIPQRGGSISGLDIAWFGPLLRVGFALHTRAFAGVRASRGC
jgi:hypothetical protein